MNLIISIINTVVAAVLIYLFISHRNYINELKQKNADLLEERGRLLEVVDDLVSENRAMVREKNKNV